MKISFAMQSMLVSAIMTTGEQTTPSGQRATTSLWKSVDQLLRGAFTVGEEPVRLSLRRLAWMCALLGGSYGLFMGTYALARGGEGAWAQILTSALKVPMLFVLTLAVTFPSLYVFSALGRSKLGFSSSLHLLLLAIALNLAVLASLGPVTAFFSLSTDSYSFMIVLNVVFFTASGLIGLAMLRRSVEALFSSEGTGAPTRQDVAEGDAPDGEKPADQIPDTGRRTRRLFYSWCLIYGVVGAQMSWLLRPFIGAPNQPFELFRARDSNFFEAFLGTLGELLGL